MRIRLLKSYVIGNRKYPIGQSLLLTNSFSNKLIKNKIATEYTGEYPPKKKVKTNLFKP